MDRTTRLMAWVVRVAFGATLWWNLQCAFSFILWPQDTMIEFGLEGTPGIVAVRGLGIAFLMWVVTYPPVIIDPVKYRFLGGIVIVQQIIGLVGESWILMGDASGQSGIGDAIQHFVEFDALGLVIMTVSWSVLMVLLNRKPSPEIKR